jgi:hypothetical protein
VNRRISHSVLSLRLALILMRLARPLRALASAVVIGISSPRSTAASIASPLGVMLIFRLLLPRGLVMV